MLLKTVKALNPCYQGLLRNTINLKLKKMKKSNKVYQALFSFLMIFCIDKCEQGVDFQDWALTASKIALKIIATAWAPGSGCFSSDWLT